MIWWAGMLRRRLAPPVCGFSGLLVCGGSSSNNRKACSTAMRGITSYAHASQGCTERCYLISISVRGSSQTVEQHQIRPKTGVRVIVSGRRAASLEPTLSRYALYVGRVGALAVALGAGVVIASMPVASATTGSEGSTDSSSGGSETSAAGSGSAGSGSGRFLGRDIWLDDECDGRGIEFSTSASCGDLRGGQRLVGQRLRG